MKKGIIITVLTILTFGLAGVFLYFAYKEDVEARYIAKKNEILKQQTEEFLNTIRNPKIKEKVKKVESLD